MTKITKQIEAAQLALDALHLWHWTGNTALEAAYDALRDAILEPAPEPEPLCTAAMFDDAFLAKSGLSPDTKLYTTPPHRKPLTDAEIDSLIAAHANIADRNLHGAVYMAMREIERAHGIGGEG